MNVSVKLTNKLRLINNIYIYFNNKSGNYVNLKILTLFRIFYPIIGLIFIYKNYNYLTYLYPSSLYYNLYNINLFDICYFISCLSLLALLFGVVTIYLRIITWLSSIIILLLGINYTIDSMLFISCTFWAIFLPLEKTKNIKNLFRKTTINHFEKDYSYIIFFWGISLLYLIFTAGYTKLLDPIWLNGLGFDYFIKLPWWSTFDLSFLYGSRLSFFMSYFVILFEIFVPFLYLFKKTRVLSIFLIALFWFQLIIPFRLDFIGVLGLLNLFPQLSIVFKPTLEKKYEK